MRKIFEYAAILTVCLAVASETTFAGEGTKSSGTNGLSARLVNDINSKVLPLQEAAMQRIIENADKVDVREALPELLNIYRYNDNEQYRLLALITIHSTKSKWAIEALKKDVKYEKSVTIKRTLNAIIKDYENNFVFFKQTNSKSVFGSR